jgi:hypothetical protein
MDTIVQRQKLFLSMIKKATNSDQSHKCLGSITGQIHTRRGIKCCRGANIPSILVTLAVIPIYKSSKWSNLQSKSVFTKHPNCNKANMK